MTQYTFASAQANLQDILNDMEAGLITSVDLVEHGDGPVVAKIVEQATFEAVDIADARDLVLVPQIQLQCGPMTNPGTNGLYKLTKGTVDIAAVPDGSIHAILQYTGKEDSGVLFTAVIGGDAGNSITIAIVDPSAIDQTLSVSVATLAITVHLATDHSGNLSSTFAEIADAVNASADASALVTALATGDTSLAPESAAATLQVTQGAGGVLYTAAAVGSAGNSITIHYVDPTVAGHAHYSYPDGVQGGNGLDFTAVATGVSTVTITVVVSGTNTALSVGVVSNAITINLATDGGGVATSTLTQIKTAYDLVAGAVALATVAITGTASTVGTAMSVQTLTSDFALSVGVASTAITVNLATNTAGVITSTAATVRAAVAGSGSAAALVNSATTGTSSTLAAAFSTTPLAGGSADGTITATPLATGDDQPTGVEKFQALGIYRKRVHSKRVGVAPTVTPRAVLISKTHADYLGL